MKELKVSSYKFFFSHLSKWKMTSYPMEFFERMSWIPHCVVLVTNVDHLFILFQCIMFAISAILSPYIVPTLVLVLFDHNHINYSFYHNSGNEGKKKNLKNWLQLILVHEIYQYTNTFLVHISCKAI